MAKFKNPYDHDRDVPLLNREVKAGETVAVPDNLAEAFVAAGWKPVTTTKQEKE